MDTNSPKKPSRFLFVLFGLCLVAALLFYFRPWAPKPPVLAVMDVKGRDVVRVLIATGRIKPKEAVNVQPKISSQIKKLNFDEGQFVKAGDVLAELDDSALKANLAQSDAALSARTADLDQSKRDLERAQTLKAKGIVGSAQLEKITTDEKRIHDDVERLEAQRQEVLSRLGDAQIKAPFDGVVLSRPVDNGQVVDAKSVLFELASLTQPEVETEVDELYAQELKADMSVHLRPAGTTTSYKGKVVYVSPKIDPKTGGRTIRVAFEGTVENMLPGQSIDINVLVARHEKALAVPRSAIGSPKDKPFVYVYEPSGFVRKTFVQFIDWPAEHIVVSTGLKEGQQVVVMAAAAKDGQRIRALHKKDTSDGKNKSQPFFNPAE